MPEGQLAADPLELIFSVYILQLQYLPGASEGKREREREKVCVCERERREEENNIIHQSVAHSSRIWTQPSRQRQCLDFSNSIGSTRLLWKICMIYLQTFTHISHAIYHWGGLPRSLCEVMHFLRVKNVTEEYGILNLASLSWGAWVEQSINSVPPQSRSVPCHVRFALPH